MKTMQLVRLLLESNKHNGDLEVQVNYDGDCCANVGNPSVVNVVFDTAPMMEKTKVLMLDLTGSQSIIG